jgi:hypothetical protein
MAFDLLSFLSTVFGGLNLPGIQDKVVAWLKEEGEEYPDLQEKADALAAWLATTLAEIAPELDPATLMNTIEGIATDIVRGASGVDPDAWQGGG